MRKVSLEDLAGPSRYGEMRDEFRRRIIALKQHRRISVGDRVTLVFENFDTVLFQTQEMLHVERITDLDRVREELDVYNELLPGENELSATLLIEITDQPRIADELRRLIGIDEHVSLRIGERAFRAQFEPGRSTEEKLSAVQYVRFRLSPEAVAELARGSATVLLEVDHPNYRASTTLDASQRASLAADLSAA